jgi:8-oxo-dGTP diphosphatase
VQASDGALSVLVVHRPAYDDWSFPKGKAEPGETDEDCALREVEEETGLVCELARELAATDYLDGKRRPKRVRYWLMTVIGGALRFDFEVDQARWVSVSDAAELLTYERDVALLESL